MKIINEKCPKCGGRLFVKKSCRSLKKKGWVMQVKCLKGCGYVAGYKRNDK